MQLDSENWLRTLYEVAHASPASDRGPKKAGAERLALSIEGVELEAWITQDVRLGMKVRVRNWNAAAEKALYDALDHDESLVAGLLLWEWPEVRRACAAAAREAAARGNAA